MRVSEERGLVDVFPKKKGHKYYKPGLNDSEIDTNLTKILLHFLKTKGSIAVNLEKTKYEYGDYKWVFELLDNVVVETTNTYIIWKLKDCTT